MRLIIADACSVILLAKCELLEVLVESLSLVIPGSVYQEIVNEKTLGAYPDAKYVHDLVEAGKVAIKNPKGKSKEIPLSLCAGEADCIRLFNTVKADMILTDDGKAIKVCRYLRIPYTISPKIVVSLFEKSLIGSERARAAIVKLEKIGRYSRDIIAESLLCLQERR